LGKSKLACRQRRFHKTPGQKFLNDHILTKYANSIGTYHLKLPTTKVSEYSFFALTLDRFSMVQVNLEIGGSSICWFSTVTAGSAGTTGAK
jgi:hypothetical protein